MVTAFQKAYRMNGWDKGPETKWSQQGKLFDQHFTAVLLPSSCCCSAVPGSPSSAACIEQWHRDRAASTFEPYVIQRCREQWSKFRRLWVDALSCIGHLGPFSGHEVFLTDASKKCNESYSEFQYWNIVKVVLLVLAWQFIWFFILLLQLLLRWKVVMRRTSDSLLQYLSLF